MQKLKNLIKFLWNELYNKHSIAAVNIYNIISAAWIIYICMDIKPHEEGLGHAFAILFTLLLNVFVYFICHIIFIIQTKKNKIMKDNPVIKNWAYRIICVLSIFIVFFHYLLFVISLVWYIILALFESQISYFANKYLVH